MLSKNPRIILFNKCEGYFSVKSLNVGFSYHSTRKIGLKNSTSVSRILRLERKILMTFMILYYSLWSQKCVQFVKVYNKYLILRISMKIIFSVLFTTFSFILRLKHLKINFHENHYFNYPHLDPFIFDFTEN